MRLFDLPSALDVSREPFVRFVVRKTAGDAQQCYLNVSLFRARGTTESDFEVYVGVLTPSGRVLLRGSSRGAISRVVCWKAHV